MRVLKSIFFCILVLALSGPAGAEVYESKDAQGNTVFSDRPSQGAEKVEVPPTNAADPVAITPRPPTPDTAPAKGQQRANGSAGADSEDRDDDDPYYYYGDDYDRDDIDEQTRRERRRDDNGVGRPIGDRPVVTPHRSVARPAGGGGGRR